MCRQHKGARREVPVAKPLLVSEHEAERRHVSCTGLASPLHLSCVAMNFLASAVYGHHRNLGLRMGLKLHSAASRIT